MHISRRPRQHPRYARFFAWLIGVLFWAACGSLDPRADRRHRARYGSYSVARLTRAVRDLILLRAADFMRRPRVVPSNRQFARAGFRRRTGVPLTLRRIAGAWLRTRLRQHRGVGRILHLIGVLSRIDDYARAVAARSTRFMRLHPLIPVRPPAARVRNLAAHTPRAADSS